MARPMTARQQAPHTLQQCCQPIFEHARTLIEVMSQIHKNRNYVESNEFAADN